MWRPWVAGGSIITRIGRHKSMDLSAQAWWDIGFGRDTLNRCDWRREVCALLPQVSLMVPQASSRFMVWGRQDSRHPYISL